LNCKVLYDFASKYAQLQTSRGDVKPSKEEIADMTKRAARVAQLLRDLKKIVNPNAASSGDEKGTVSATSDEYRAPKRPWEEISKDQPEASHTSTVSSVIHSVMKLATLTCPSCFLFPVSMTHFLIADRCRLQTPDIRGPQVYQRNPATSRPPLRRIWRLSGVRGLRLRVVPSSVTKRPSTGNEV